MVRALSRLATWFHLAKLPVDWVLLRSERPPTILGKIIFGRKRRARSKACLSSVKSRGRESWPRASFCGEDFLSRSQDSESHRVFRLSDVWQEAQNCLAALLQCCSLPNRRRAERNREIEGRQSQTLDNRSLWSLYCQNPCLIACLPAQLPTLSSFVPYCR